MLDAIRSNLILDHGATVLGVSLQSRYTGLVFLARYIVRPFRVWSKSFSRGCPDCPNSTICQAAKDALLKLNKYYNSGIQPVIKMATCLDPGFKLRALGKKIFSVVKYTRSSDDSEAYYQFFAKTDFWPYIDRYIIVNQLLAGSSFVTCQHCSRDVDVFRTSEPQLCTVCYAAYNRRMKSSIDKENIPDGELAQFTLDPTIITNGHTGPDELEYDKATSAGGDSGRALVCLFGKSGNAGEIKIQPDFGLAATLANQLVEARLEWSEDQSIMLPRGMYKLVGRYHGNGMLAKKSAMKDYRTYANVPNVVQQWNVQDEDYILLTGLHPAAFGTGNPLYQLEFLYTVSLRVSLRQVFLVFLGHTSGIRPPPSQSTSSSHLTAGGSAMEASFCKVESYQSLLELWFSLKSPTHRVKLDRDLVLNTVKRMFYVYLYAYSVSTVVRFDADASRFNISTNVLFIRKVSCSILVWFCHISVLSLANSERLWLVVVAMEKQLRLKNSLKNGAITKLLINISTKQLHQPPLYSHSLLIKSINLKSLTKFIQLSAPEQTIFKSIINVMIAKSIKSAIKRVSKFVKRVFGFKKAQVAEQELHLSCQVTGSDFKKNLIIPIIVVHPPPELDEGFAELPQILSGTRIRTSSVASDDSEASYQSFASEESSSFDNQMLPWFARVDRLDIQGSSSQNLFESLQSRRSSLNSAIEELQRGEKVRPWSCPPPSCTNFV
ncbi:hypothetical protein MP228_005724 [Amoeboaphelidium protococcarum]|nr:hypothetical protein MP228_005724 [Amoeboaphelidium protococcarum]